MKRIAGFLGMMGAAMAARAAAPAAVTPPQLSVMTYNVEGLPWPVRTDRTDAEQAIGQKLHALRQRGVQPHILVLQEAFTDSAKAIATEGGYRYIANGPARDDAGAPPTTAADRQFMSGARMMAGETVGKWVDSGLRIASDYPILAVRRMAYPSYACAGLDCLANKGALAVEIAVPGLPQPVVVVATHMNSRAAAGVSFDRSFYAYRRQVDALGHFIASAAPASWPLIVAGDFNAGQGANRRAYLVQSAAHWRPQAGMSVAMNECLAQQSCTKSNAPDIQFSFRRERDWQFFSPGTGVGLRVAGLNATFGHDAHGAMLSDHVGYMADYAVSAKPTAGLTRLASR
ncbi:endonuclease/exonuclease/phosphatase family protein [Sphingomonas sp.]|uniref:endonuclease/exonuclease/phosphatase family protein n=1 Tax=Sphingomonas sp. TaxID=28214 RepID=UPI003B3B76AB